VKSKYNRFALFNEATVYPTMAWEGYSLRPFITNAGSGFIMSQALAAVSATYHSIVHAPGGSKISDFLGQFRCSGRKNGASMMEWSVVNTALDPWVNHYIAPGVLRNCVGGALTGAVVEIRNGFTGCLGGAVSGAFQSLAQQALVHSIGMVVRPIHAWRRETIKNKFIVARDRDVFGSPFSVVAQAFGD
jgi:hypothetical protein